MNSLGMRECGAHWLFTTECPLICSGGSAGAGRSAPRVRAPKPTNPTPSLPVPSPSVTVQPNSVTCTTPHMRMRMSAPPLCRHRRKTCVLRRGGGCQTYAGWHFRVSHRAASAAQGVGSWPASRRGSTSSRHWVAPSPLQHPCGPRGLRTGNANPAARTSGDHHGTGVIVPFVLSYLRTFEWGAVIATCLSVLSIVPRHCARLTYFLHPKLRGINAVLITPQPMTLLLQRLRRAGGVPTAVPFHPLRLRRGSLPRPGAPSPSCSAEVSEHALRTARERGTGT